MGAAAARHKAAAAHCACDRPCRRRAARCATGAGATRLPRPLLLLLPAPLFFSHPAPAAGDRGPHARCSYDAVPRVGHSPPLVLAGAPPLVLETARIRAESDRAAGRGECTAAHLALCLDRSADRPVGPALASLAVGMAAAARGHKVASAYQAWARLRHRAAQMAPCYKIGPAWAVGKGRSGKEPAAQYGRPAAHGTRVMPFRAHALRRPVLRPAAALLRRRSALPSGPCWLRAAPWRAPAPGHASGGRPGACGRSRG